MHLGRVALCLGTSTLIDFRRWRLSVIGIFGLLLQERIQLTI